MCVCACACVGGAGVLALGLKTKNAKRSNDVLGVCPAALCLPR